MIVPAGEQFLVSGSFSLIITDIMHSGKFFRALFRIGEQRKEKFCIVQISQIVFAGRVLVCFKFLDYRFKQLICFIGSIFILVVRLNKNGWQQDFCRDMSGFCRFANIVIITSHEHDFIVSRPEVGENNSVKCINAAVFDCFFLETDSEFSAIGESSGGRCPNGSSGDIAHDPGLFKITVFQRLFPFEIDFLIDNSAMLIPRFQCH